MKIIQGVGGNWEGGQGRVLRDDDSARLDDRQTYGESRTWEVVALGADAVAVSLITALGPQRKRRPGPLVMDSVDADPPVAGIASLSCDQPARRLVALVKTLFAQVTP